MAHYARNQHQQHHRPQPLSLHPSSSHSHQNYPTPLHSAPLPSHTQYANMPSAQHRQQHGGGNAPLSAAYAQFQSSQLAYLQEMERNLVLQQQLQQQIMLQQQQVELEQQAERAMREMSIAATAASLGVAHHAPPPPPPSQQQRGHGGQGRQHFQQQSQAPANQNQAPNPLVASALARRAKRQSFNGTDGQYAPHQQQLQQAYSPAAQAPRFAQSQQPHHQRRATPPHLSPSHSPARSSGFTRGSSPSPVSANSSSHSPSPTTRGPRRPSPPPPAVILSAPGEPYPDTSSSGSSSSRAGSEDGGSDSGETRPSSPEREKEVKRERRRSHLDSLAMLGAAASARNANASRNVGGNRNERRRPVSVNGPPGGVPSPRLPSTFSRDAPPHAHALAHPAHGKRTVSTPASTGALSASASSFAPLPASPAPPLAHSTSSPATSAFGFSRQSAPPVPGTATATRQPKGPPTELGKSEEGVNFGQRIRQRAVRDLRGLALARGAGRAGVISPPQQQVVAAY